MDVMKRQEQLDLKEKELNAREQELKRQQEQMIADGTLKPIKNWPKCYPVTKHDIDGEVKTQPTYSSLDLRTADTLVANPLSLRKWISPSLFSLWISSRVLQSEWKIA